MPNWELGTGPSADISIVAGADFSSAYPLATKPKISGGSFTLDFAGRKADPQSDAPVTVYDMPVALIRTGTGSINIAAAKDVTLKLMSIDQLVGSVDQESQTGNISVFDYKNTVVLDKNPYSQKHSVSVVGASIYTAGEASDLSAVANVPYNLINLHYVGEDKKSLDLSSLYTPAAFGQNGGSLSVKAGGSVQGAAALEPQKWYVLNGDGGTPQDEFDFYIGTERGARLNAQNLAKAKIAELAQDTADYSNVSLKPVYVKDPGGNYFKVTFNHIYQTTQDWLPTTVSPLVNTWLFRQGRSSLSASDSAPDSAWWVRTDYFNQSMATLGGGDLSISAQGSIRDVYASTATNAYANGTGSIQQQGGGDITVRAGGDLAGVALFIQKGVANVSTGGAITSGSSLVFGQDSSGVHTKTVDSSSDARVKLQSVFALGDARLSLVALKDISVGVVYNPTLSEQSVFNRTVNPVVSSDYNGFTLGTTAGVNNDTANIYFNAFPIITNTNYFSPTQEGIATYGLSKFGQQYSQFSNFSTYTDRSSFSALSLGGGVTLKNDPNPLAWSGMTLVANDLAKLSGYTFGQLYTLSPSKFQVVSMNGSLTSDNGFVLMPSGQGQLSMWANQSILMNNGANGPIHMLDVAAESISSANAPRLFLESDLSVLFDGFLSNFTTHAPTPLHAGDPQSASIVSLSGDVIGDINLAKATINLPKNTSVIAGRDILNLGFILQNVDQADVSSLSAGRDVRDDNTNDADCTRVSSACLQHLLYGPGMLKVSAGRDIDLGNLAGIVTKGNQGNPFLAYGGASVMLGASKLEPNYSSLDEYIRSKLAGNPISSAALAGWSLSEDSSVKNKIFFELLVDASKLKNANGGALNLTYFDGLVSAMFPGASGSSLGNISTHSSQIKTEQGGSIDIFAPLGSVFAGLAQGAQVASPSNQGIFTIRGGDINALVYKEFLVNQGRIFTLGGGDITLVSQYGNLEAGKGAKTASSAPPPLITIDANGNTKLDVSNSIAGSGIATLFTHPGQPASNVYAVAPRGYFDAGDAGVRSTGSVEINAPTVRNADNIVATGTISNTQAPPVAAPAVAPVASPSAPAPTSTDDAKKSLPSNATSLASLSVELLGLGETQGEGGAALALPSAEKDEDADRKEDKSKNLK